MKDREEQILIACIGNLFLGDDEFGVEAARVLAKRGVPEGAVLIDYGIRSLDLAYALLEPWRAVILVDAVTRGGVSGTIYLLAPSDVQARSQDFNAHAMGPAAALEMALSIGPVSAPIYIVGCEPKDFGEELEGRIGLSPSVAAAVSKAACQVLRIAEEIGHTCISRTSHPQTTAV
jgi:hydrogenase maturation protease